MAGEELPPVVAVIEGDDAGLLEMFDRDIAAARSFAADLQAALEEGLGGITVSGAQISGEGIGAAGEVIGEQFAAGFEEGAGALDLRPEMQGASQGAAEIGQAAGDELASGILEGAAATGDQIVREIAAPLTDGMAEVGAEAGAAAGGAIDSALAASTVGAGRTVAEQINEELRTGLEATSLSGAFGAAGTAAAAAVSSVSGAGFLAGLPAAMRAAGMAAGAGLTEGLVEGSAGAGSQIAGLIGGELRSDIAAGAEAAASRLTDAFVESSAGIGDAIASQVGQEMGPGIADAGERAGEALKEALIEGASGAGDVLGAQIGAGIPDGVAPGADAGAAAVEQAMQSLTSELEVEGEEAGARYAEGLQRGMNSVNIPLGGLPIEELLGGGVASNPFVQDPNNPYRSVRQDVLDAEQAAQQAAAAIAASETESLDLANTVEAELMSVFNEIYRGGVGMTDQLATAMTLAWAGIEADTEGFTGAELRIFEQFFTALEAEGDQAALALAARMHLVSEAAVSGMDFMQEGLTTFGQPIPGTEAAGVGGGPSIYGIANPEPSAASARPSGISVPGLAIQDAAYAKQAAAATDEVATAAKGADAAMGGMAATMGGPLMFGLMGVAGFLPMLSGLFSSGSQAAAAYTQQQQQLEQAVSQDSNMVGANTVATIANQLATSGAADTLQGYGISLSDATAAMAGASSAQTAVNGTLQNQIDGLQGLITEQEAHAAASNAQIDTEKQQLVQLQATQQAMRDLENDVVSAVAHQNELTQATLNAEQAVDVYNVQVRAGVLALQQQAQTAHMTAVAQGAYDMALVPGAQAYKAAISDQTIALADNAIKAQINALALNQSLAPQAQLSTEAVTAATAYQDASTATGAYTNALTALYGQYGQTSGAQAAFTTALTGLNGQVAAGTNAVDLNTAAGAKNFTAFNSVATAAEGYAEKLYQQTGDAGQATNALQAMATQLDLAATKAHLTAGQVQQLNTELFGVPNVKDITIALNPTPAEQQMSALRSFVETEIDGINSKPINLFLQGEVASVNNTPPDLTGGGRALLPSRDAGGPVDAGEAYMIGLNRRPEIFVPGASGYITPMDMLTPAFAASGASGGGPGLGSAAGSDTPVVNVAIYLDGKLITTGARTETQWYKRRNGQTGFN